MRKCAVFATMFLFLFGVRLNAQYSVSQSVDRLYLCNSGQVIKETARVQSFNANTFKGFIFHFYYFTGGSYSLIGNYTVQLVGASLFTNPANIQPVYFDGSQLRNATTVINTGSQLWISIDIRYATFPNSSGGQQFAVDVEAIDQGGSTTTHSAKTDLGVPFLYSNSTTLSSAATVSSVATICGSDVALLSTNPDLSGKAFLFDWYKDGSLLQSGETTGNISVNTAGTYHVYIYDACQNTTASDVVITAGAAPAAPTISPAGPVALCNGNSVTLTIPGGGNTNWFKDGGLISANSGTQVVSDPGSYTATLNNACGISGQSAPVIVTTNYTPPAPSITSSNGTVLCNGGSTTLSTSPSAGGTIYWSNGATGNSITVSSAGSYYAYESNGCGNSYNSNMITITTAITPAQPTLSASNGLFLCDGQTTTLTTSPNAGGSIHWSIGVNGNSITLADPGLYYVTEINGCGAATTFFGIGTGSTPPVPSISAAGSTVLCNGNSTTLTASGSGTKLWFFNGSSFGSPGSSISVSALGSYFARAANSCGTSGNSNTITITNNITPPAPLLNVSGSILLCDGVGQTITTSPSTSGGSIQWSTGATGNTITVFSPGTYYAWEVNGSCGSGPNSLTVVISTLSKPAAPLVTPGGNQLVCNGASTTLQSTGNSITWSNGSTGTTMTTGTAGNYYAVDHNTCGNSPNSNTVQVITGNCPIPSPDASFFVCPGFTKTLHAGSGYDSYQWNTGATTESIVVGPGTYWVTVTSQGCFATSGNVTVAYYNVTAPVITALGPTTFCNGGSVSISSTVGATYAWSNGATTNPITVSTAGTFSVAVTDNNGCVANSNSITTFVNPLPAGTISGSTTICQNSSSPVITFTGSNATAPYTFTYNINGGANQTVTTTSGNSVTVAVPTNAAGSFVYNLLSVKESSSTACSNTASGSATVVVNPLPSASISGSTTVCQNSVSPMVTFTGANATAPYTFTYTINGGANQTITTISGNSISIPVPTINAATIVYALVSVKESSGTSCINVASGSATFVINPLPSATITGTTTVCQKSVSPLITFRGSNGTAPYTFTYNINGGANQTVTTTSGNSVTIAAPTFVSGTFTYNLISVQDGSSTACSQNVEGSASVIVNPLPVAAVITAANMHLCNGEYMPISITNYTSGFSYIWYYNGDSLRMSSLDTIMNKNAGSFKVIPVSDKGCKGDVESNTIIISTGTIAAPVITGYLKVCEGGKTRLAVHPQEAALGYEVWRWTDPPRKNLVSGDSSFSFYAGQYQILVERQGCYDSAFVIVTADDTEYPAGKLIITPSSIHYGESANIRADVTGAVEYRWDLGNGTRLNTTTSTLSENYFVASDSVPVQLWAVSERNCITHFSEPIAVSAQTSLGKAPPFIAGNLKDWNVFPNPFGNELKVSVILSRIQTVRIDLFAGDGKWLRSWVLNGRKGENLFYLEGVDLLSSGVMYFITGVYDGKKHFDKVFKN